MHLRLRQRKLLDCNAAHQKTEFADYLIRQKLFTVQMDKGHRVSSIAQKFVVRTAFLAILYLAKEKAAPMLSVSVTRIAAMIGAAAGEMIGAEANGSNAPKKMASATSTAAKLFVTERRDVLLNGYFAMVSHVTIALSETLPAVREKPVTFRIKSKRRASSPPFSLLSAQPINLVLKAKPTAIQLFYQTLSAFLRHGHKHH
ncbi:hypothetical protein [Brucella gallinifaecis]|uniref:hypothetical protein n=1 Tax=Brucella gallinifaecis TaxID=215590 RepID=UPI0023606D17|nr:hypothetical protein [Brucella gallinifaecis]